MNWIPISMLLALFSTAGPQAIPTLQVGEWFLGGPKPAAYVMEANGSVTDPNGATVVLRSAADASGIFGTALSQLSANALRGRRVTISGDLQTRGVTGGAFLWLRLNQDDTILMQENWNNRALRGDTDWTPRSVSLPVPGEAGVFTFGVQLLGGGSVSIRGLRLDVSAPLDLNAPIDASAKQVVDEAISVTKENALRRNDVAWDAVEPKVRLLAAGARQSSDGYPAIRYLLAQLGDHHSFFLTPAEATQLQTGGAQNPIPEVRALPEGVGYISMPGYDGADPAAIRLYATRTHEALGGTIASASCGWVVDLRKDRGGNDQPMLAGLKPFLGNNVPPWFAAQGVGVEPSSTLAAMESSWTAVLTGPQTASAGEVITVAFRGRPRTRSFGQPTAGLSTGNRKFLLPDGSAIFVTTSVYVDRAGRQYGGTIDPDERIEATASGGDATLSAAVQWLKRSSGCGKVPE